MMIWPNRNSSSPRTSLKLDRHEAEVVATLRQLALDRVEALQRLVPRPEAY
jgi:hypothetical protein